MNYIYNLQVLGHKSLTFFICNPLLEGEWNQLTLSQLRMFGCIAYSHILDDEKRGMLDDKSEKCILVA